MLHYCHLTYRQPVQAMKLPCIGGQQINATSVFSVWRYNEHIKKHTITHTCMHMYLFIHMRSYMYSQTSLSGHVPDNWPDKRDNRITEVWLYIHNVRIYHIRTAENLSNLWSSKKLCYCTCFCVIINTTHPILTNNIVRQVFWFPLLALNYIYKSLRFCSPTPWCHDYVALHLCLRHTSSKHCH